MNIIKRYSSKSGHILVPMNATANHNISYKISTKEYSFNMAYTTEEQFLKYVLDFTKAVDKWVEINE